MVLELGWLTDRFNPRVLLSRVRTQLPPGAFLELHVTVDKDWQSKAASLERLGY